jgi:hypothetical protein
MEVPSLVSRPSHVFQRCNAGDGLDTRLEVPAMDFGTALARIIQSFNLSYPDLKPFPVGTSICILLR